jgi:hypothetical protein
MKISPLVHKMNIFMLNEKRTEFIDHEILDAIKRGQEIDTSD